MKLLDESFVRKLRLNTTYLVGHEEKLFRHFWAEMGTARSNNKLSLWCGSIGIVNPVTGSHPTPLAVWKAMWRWACRKENHDISYEIFNKAQQDMGEFYTKEEYIEFLKERSFTANQYSPHRQKRFLIRNGFIVE